MLVIIVLENMKKYVITNDPHIHVDYTGMEVMAVTVQKHIKTVTHFTI